MKFSLGFDGKTKRMSVFLKGVRENLKNGLQGRARMTGEMINDQIGREIRAFAKEPTGELERSWQISVIARSKGHMEIRVSSKAPHAGIYESGGTIKPVNAGSLVVPLTAKARAVRKQGPRHFPGKLFVPKGGKTLAQKGGPGGGITHHFALVKRVRVKPRRYLTKAMSKVGPRLEKLYRQTLEHALDRAAREAK